MIPWRITVSTYHTPDEVLQKLESLIEKDISKSSSGESDENSEEPKTILGLFRELHFTLPKLGTFGGNVNLSKHSFRIICDPDKFEAGGEFHFKTIYQGHVVYHDGKSRIKVWVRPEFGVLAIYAIVFPFLAFLLFHLIKSGQLSVTIIVSYLFFLGADLFMTYRNVRKARKLFENLFPDRDRRILDKVS